MSKIHLGDGTYTKLTTTILIFSTIYIINIQNDSQTCLKLFLKKLAKIMFMMSLLIRVSTQIIFKIPVFIVQNLVFFQDFVLKKVPFSSPNGENLIKFQSWFSKFYYVIKNYKV